MGVYTFSFLPDTKQIQYEIACRKCNATIPFVLQQSTIKGALQCPYCSVELQIWETHDSKEVRKLSEEDDHSNEE